MVPQRDRLFAAVVQRTEKADFSYMLHRIIPHAILLLAATPAMAEGGAQVPEASSLSLFALGVLGVLVGRRLSMRKSDKDD